MIRWLCFTQPFRRWLLYLIDYLPQRSGDWLADQLYPDDAIFYFEEGEDPQ